MIQTISQWQGNFVADGIFIRAQAVDDHTDKLTPSELKAIGTSVAVRRHTYSTGRLCAKTALRDIGFDHRDYSDGLLRQEDGSALWPEAAVGSISHTNDWAIAAVAKSSSDYLSLGVDIEKIDRVNTDVLRHIATDEERRILESDFTVRWGRVALFSIKESLYKCLRPFYGTFFGFKDVQVSNLNTPLIHGDIHDNAHGETDGGPTVQPETQPEFYSPAINLILPSLAECCDEHRISARLAILPQHVISLVTYRKAPG